MKRESELPILTGLNERQIEAVTAADGQILVIAGPGSGKTRALTHRIAYLIQKGAAPESILAVTFTNKAAEEMRERVQKLLASDQNDDSDQSAFGLDKNVLDQFHQAKRFTKRSDVSPSTLLPFIGTFHSFSAYLLRSEAASIGYTSRFSIYDEDDAMAVLKEVMKELNLSSKQYPAGMISSVLSGLKNDLIAWDEYEGRNDSELFPRTIAKIYEAYETRLKLANAIDFDGLLFHAVRLLREHTLIRNRSQERFRWIHIDEYQDTNTAQYELVRLLSGKHQNLFVIGDDAQSIYRWRRADYRNILNFERDWPSARVILLEENYRSTPEILKAANDLIGKNKNQKEKTLWTKNPSGEAPIVRVHENERREAEFVATEIAELQQARSAPWREFAVLYRTNAQSRALEEAVIEYGIPYAIIGGIRFWQRREVKDIVAYLRFLENPADAVALKRIINVPARGIGPKTLLAYVSGGIGRLQGRDRKNAEAFEAVVKKLREAMQNRTIAEFLRFLIDTLGYEAYLEDFSRDGENRIENTRELVTLARRYDAFPIHEAATKLMEDVALASDQDEAKTDGNAVRLMTLHAAKGLEFSTVFITGLEEGILPHAKSVQGGSADLEEERRLCYVGMTRAKTKLYLTWALQRTIFGERQVNMPSRFLRELPEELLRGHIILDEESLLIDAES